MHGKVVIYSEDEDVLLLPRYLHTISLAMWSVGLGHHRQPRHALRRFISTVQPRKSNTRCRLGDFVMITVVQIHERLLESKPAVAS